MSRVHLVEDNPDSRVLLTLVLEQWYEVRAYEDGPSALEGLASDRPDCLVLDVSLPGMSGLEVLASLRGDEALAALPVIALTAHAMSGDRERMLAAGFDAYVQKPLIDDEILHAAVEGLLSR